MSKKTTANSSGFIEGGKHLKPKPYLKIKKKKWPRNSVLINPLFTYWLWIKPVSDSTSSDTLA